MPEKKRGLPKTRVGRVVSNKMDKTVILSVERLVKHPVYKKFVRRSRKLYAHDKDNSCQIGDLVKVIETRPLSKTKRWKVVQIVERAK